MLQETYSTKMAAKLAGLTFRQVSVWDMDKFIQPSGEQAHGTGTRRRYTFGDLVALRTAAALLRTGASLPGLKKAAEQLRSIANVTFQDAFLTWSGDDILWRDGEQLISMLRQPGQATFLIVNVSTIRGELREMLKEKAA